MSQLYADLSEAQCGVIDMLRSYEIPVKVGRLAIADYLISTSDHITHEAFAFERKTFSDFIASKLDGRLNRQLIEMSTHFHRSFIIIEGGASAALIDSAFDRKTLYSTITSTVLRRSTEGVQGVVSMIPTELPYDTAFILKYAYDKISSGDVDLHPNAGAMKSTNREIAIVATVTNNVGPSKAKALLLRFGSVANICNATVEQLDEVDGIGRKTAESIFEALHKQFIEQSIQTV